MGLTSFKRQERHTLITLPNLLTLTRALGGPIFGVALATRHIGPIAAVCLTVLFAVTDLEGLTIRLTKRWPKLQKLFHIVPSRWGRKWDAIADKIFALSVLVGAMIGGQIPVWQAAGILIVEVATAAATLFVTARGGDPETSKAGTFGMVARCVAIASNFAANATTGMTHRVFELSGIVTAVIAILLGLISCYRVCQTKIPAGKPR